MMSAALAVPAGKLQAVMSTCTKLGVKTEPAMVDGVWICPLMSWYHASFDQEPDIEGAPSIEKACRHEPSLLLARPTPEGR